jgi:DNA-binding SARP family transcriptional activator
MPNYPDEWKLVPGCWDGSLLCVELLVLGPVRAVVAGRPVDLGPPKQRALFALLLARADRVVAVDTVTDLLWAGEPPARSSASLQAYVSRLRRLLEPDRAPGAPPTVLVTAAPGYVLRTAGATMDVREFAGLAARGRSALDDGAFPAALTALDAAAALWRGDAYADVRDAEWIRPELARLAELRLSAAEDRAAALTGLGREAEAIAELDAHVLAHPLRERGWQLLVRALYRAGRQGDALGVLRSARTRLVEELGVDPGPELRRLEEAVLRQDPALERPPGAGSRRRTDTAGPADTGPASDVGAVAAPRPFIGRADALATLRAAAAGLAAGRGGVVLVDGEPGIGKTRLVERFTGEVGEPGRFGEHGAAGVPVAWGRCPDHEVAPALWPWEQVLRAIPGGLPMSEVAALLGGGASGHDPDGPIVVEVGDPGASGVRGPAPKPEIAGLLHPASARVAPGGVDRLDRADPAGARLRLYEAVTAHLTGVAPLVVVLDDLHWADSASLRLLVHVAQAGAAVLVVGTFRRHEASGLSDTLAALARVGARRVHLDGLAPGEVRELVGALAGTDPGAARAAELGARSGGNPFFLGELARLTGAEPLPAAVRDVVLRRVAQLPEPVGALLGTAAVAGLEFDAATVFEVARPEVTGPEVAGLDMEAGLDLLDIALAAGLVVEDADRLGTLRFAHALIPDALAGRHSRLRRARLHRRFGEVTARRWAGRPDRAGEVARHWLAAAELDAATAAIAVEHAAAAARAAESRLAHEDAAGFWQEALAAAELAGLPDRFELLLGLTRAQHAAGEVPDGLAVLDQVLAAAGDDPQRVVRAAVTVFGSSMWYPFPYGSRPAALLAALQAALQSAAPRPVTDPGEYALALAVLAAVRNHVGEPDAPLAARAAELARTTGDPRLLARVLHFAMSATSNVDAEPDSWALAAELAALPGAPRELTASARIAVCSGLLATGRIAEAHALLDELAPVLAQLRSPLLSLQAGIQRAALLALHGELDAAERLWDELLAGAGPAGLTPSRLSHRIDVAWQRGTLAELEPELAGAVAATGMPAFAGGHALTLLAADRPDEAIRLLREVPPPPRDYTWLHTMVGRLAVALAVGDREQITSLRAELLPFRDRLGTSGTGVAIFGSVLGHLGEAALALGDVDTARAELTEALAVLDRIGAPYWAGRVRRALESADRQADRQARGKGSTSPAGEAVPSS